ncbi:unnamed protein product [Discula destructiva]
MPYWVDTIPWAYRDGRSHREKVRPFGSIPQPVKLPLEHCTKSLSRNLEKSEAPYGSQRSRMTRLKVRLGLFHGGEEHSFRVLYQRRLRRIMRACPQYFEDATEESTKWLELKSFVAGCPFNEHEEDRIRQTIEDFCYQIWVVDEIVRRLHIRSSAEDKGRCGSAEGAKSSTDGAKSCEFWNESRCEQFLHCTGEPSMDAAKFRGIKAHFSKSLKSFRGSGFDKPLLYLTMCVFEHVYLRLGDEGLRSIQAKIEKVEADIYNEASRRHVQLQHGADTNKAVLRKRQQQKLEKRVSEKVSWRQQQRMLGELKVDQVVLGAWAYPL